VTDPIAKAQRVLVDLRQKLDESRDRALAPAGDRDVVAYEAHTGDQNARRRLDKINQEFATMASENASLEAARRDDAFCHLISGPSSPARELSPKFDCCPDRSIVKEVLDIKNVLFAPRAQLNIFPLSSGGP
jgi:hypothetical protein